MTPSGRAVTGGARINPRTPQPYGWHIDNGEWEEWASLFAENAVLSYSGTGTTLEGRDGLLADFQAAWEEYPFMNPCSSTRWSRSTARRPPRPATGSR